MTPKISCTMIVRDEASTLRACLESIRPHVDELVLVDTGSTDDTPAICRSFADTYREYTGCNDAEGRIQDFSLARNHALSLATQEAVCWFDGDDVVRGGENLRKLASEAYRGEAAWSWVCPYEYDRDAAGRVTTLQWRERLVYPRVGWEWRGPVHEGLLGKAGVQPVTRQTDLVVVEHRNRASSKPRDPQRNLRILESYVRRVGEADARMLHYFGAELLTAGRIGEACHWFRRHAALSSWSDERCLSLMHLARVASAMGDWQVAVDWALQASATKSWPEPYWTIGAAFVAMAELGWGDAEYNLKRGVHFLEQGFRLDTSQAESLLMKDPQARYDAHGWLAPALAKLGRIDDALRSAELGLAGKPDHAELKANLLDWKRQRVLTQVAELDQLGGLKAGAVPVIGAAVRGEFGIERRDLYRNQDLMSQAQGPDLQGNWAVGLGNAEANQQYANQREYMEYMRRELDAAMLGGSGVTHAAGRGNSNDRNTVDSEAAATNKLRIAFWLGHQLEPWTPETLERDGMGGSETMAWEMSKRLAKLGHDVRVFAHCEKGRMYQGVAWNDASAFSDADEYDVLIVSRQAAAVTLPHKAKARVLWVHDVHVGQDFTPALAIKYDFIWCLSQWHKQFFCQCYPWLNPDKVEVTRNGIDPKRFSAAASGRAITRRPHHAIYSSSPDRGLAEAVAAWPTVRAAIPDAELHVYYGFENWERSIELGGENGVPQCSRAALEALKKAVAETPGVVLHGRVNQRELAEAMLGAGVWFYPTWFSETSCITAMEAQAAGLDPVCPRLAALAETVAPMPDGCWWDGTTRHAAALCIAAMEQTGDEGRIEPTLTVRFSLDTLASAWEARLNKLVADATERVVPAFMEAAQ